MRHVATSSKSRDWIKSCTPHVEVSRVMKKISPISNRHSHRNSVKWSILWFEESLWSKVIGLVWALLVFYGYFFVLFHSSWTMNGTFEEHLQKKYLKGGYSTLGFWDNGKQSSWFRTKLPYFRDIYPLYWFCLFIYWSFLGRIISTQIRQVKSFSDFNGAVPRVQN